MFDEVKIDGFRCFRSAIASGLRRINIVVGANASGKTTFLEAIFFAAGSSPELALRMRAWRGLVYDRLRVSTGEPDSSAAAWADLFYQMDQKKDVSVVLKEGNRARSVRVEFVQTNKKLRIGKDAAVDVVQVPLRFTWRTKEGRNFVEVPEITPSGLKVGGHAPSITGVFHNSSTLSSPLETADRFSALSRRHEVDSVVAAVRRLFPMVESLSVELNQGSPMLYAGVGGLPEKVPIGLISTGVQKIVAILVSIAASRGGLVLVDELENGLYYQTIPAVWQSMASLAAECDVQLFVSTHSQECLRACAQSLGGQADDVALLRIEQKDLENPIRSFSGSEAFAAIENDLEIR